MLFRFTSLWIAAGLIAAMWSLDRTRSVRWVRPIGVTRGPVKILQFYANVGHLNAGQKALLCYGVENARSVRVSPAIDGIYPTFNRCVEIGPDHTTHYTILAEGFDGHVATSSFTLPVTANPPAPRLPMRIAAVSE